MQAEKLDAGEENESGTASIQGCGAAARQHQAKLGDSSA